MNLYMPLSCKIGMIFIFKYEKSFSKIMGAEYKGLREENCTPQGTIRLTFLQGNSNSKEYILNQLAGFSKNCGKRIRGRSLDGKLNFHGSRRAL